MTNHVVFNLADYRQDSESTWALPAWSHPLAQCVLPLFASSNDHLTPIGTAFYFSKKVLLLASAEHNIREILKIESNGEALRRLDVLPKTLSLKRAGLFVLHQHTVKAREIVCTLVPIETVASAQPADVVVSFPKIALGIPVIVPPVSFEYPPPGSTVRCVGYANFIVPTGGIPLDAVRDGSFDWEHDYSHEFLVSEAQVSTIFTQRFSNGFMQGPCFTVEAALEHGMSGGPCFDLDGRVIGVNSAGAQTFLSRPASIVSLLFPILSLDVKCSLSMGPMSIGSNIPLAELAVNGSINCGDSYKSVHFTEDPEGRVRIGLRIKKEHAHNVFDDFPGYQEGKQVTRGTGEVMEIRATDSSND